LFDAAYEQFGATRPGHLRRDALNIRDPLLDRIVRGGKLVLL